MIRVVGAWPGMPDATHPTHASYLEGQRLARRAVNAAVQAVLGHWLGLHDRQRLPSRDRLDPVDLPRRALPHLFLLEYTVGEPWRLRLMGSHLVAALGHDFTGRRLVDEQIPSISKSRTVRLLASLVESGLPVHFHGRSDFRFNGGYADHEQVLLPFRRRDDDTIEIVLGAIVYEGLVEHYGPARSW